MTQPSRSDIIQSHRLMEKILNAHNIELHDEIQYIPIQINRRRETIKPHKRVL